MKDVIVIGGGAGGVPAAIRASQLGADVAIVEANQFGGLCMNRACVPFGHMMVATRILSEAEFGQKMGLSFDNVSTDFSALKKRQEELIDFMRKGVSSTLKKNNIELLEGKGHLAGKGKVAVNGKTLDCKHVILATGGAWAKPDFPGGDLDAVINTDTLLGMEQLPKKVLLFGRSPWLLEIAQFLNSFGVDATVAIQEKAILPDESKTIHSRLRKALKDQGIDIKREAVMTNVSKQKNGLKADITAKEGKATVSADCILYIEREAALKDLGLSSVGLDETREYLETDARMETKAKGVYAIGDLTGPGARHYSHFSSEGGIVAAEIAMGLNAAMNPHTFTRVLFTRPQVACVGLTPKAAKKAGYDTIVGAAPYGMNPLGMLMAENEGIVEVVAESKYGEILGVHFIGGNAAEMAGQAVLTIQLEATMEDLARASFPHPTLSESLSEAARNALGRHIYLP